MNRPPHALLTVALLLPATGWAAEGMWPFDMVPVKAIAEAYHFDLKPALLDRARAASVRLTNGASGSFVTGHGLVMTNHHVAAGCIQQLTQGGAEDLIGEGFLAATRADERPCPGFEANRLEAIEDVTARVKAAALGPDEAARNAARKKEMAAIEAACKGDDEGRRCDVVTLYAGGAYHLYRYRRFTDVRLVFAPEASVAAFGGDPDNFEFPRACLDVSFLRVYLDGEPLATPAHLPLSGEGAVEGALTFVSGHPGSTDRLRTPAELGFLRDVAYPFYLRHLKAREAAIEAFMAQGPEQKRLAYKSLSGVQNGLKAIGGYLRGLRDPALMKAVEARHAEVRAKLAKLPAAERDRLLEAWPKLELAAGVHASFMEAHAVTEGWAGPRGVLMGHARTLLRLSAELPKASGDRLREYRDSNLGSVDNRLSSAAPAVPGLELIEITAGLRAMRQVLGADHPAVRAALGGLSPEARAAAVVKGSALGDPEVRARLRAHQAEGVRASHDPALELARAYEATARALRARYEDEVQSVERAYASRIAEAWAKAHGTSVYPDATFTLRLSYGLIKGYRDGGRDLPWATTFKTLYEKLDAAKGQAPWSLPARWLAARTRLDLSTPLNFVSTHDIIGGNSGSPVFDTQGRAVGLIFDGNPYMLPNRFLYREAQGRAISVHAAAILTALDKVYEAKNLLAELRAP